MAKRVLVAMSGGVDSSVTAWVLREKGYDCIGTTMMLHGADGGAAPGGDAADEGAATCGSSRDLADAEAICSKLGIPWHAIDLRREFDRDVVEPFVRTYENGRTPNPCISCNRYMKFGALLDHAREIGCDHIATGHYAQVLPAFAHAGGAKGPGGVLESLIERAGGNFPTLSCGIDPAKDQSYVLYSLDQERLAHTLLPLGGMLKERDVRRIAREQGFVNAGKRDSQGICFVPGNDVARYIESRRGHALERGAILDSSGKVLGSHPGAIRYTIGQRKGLGVAEGRPMYVTAIDAAANTVTLGSADDLASSALLADDWIWCVPEGPIEGLLEDAGEAGLPVLARIRYHHKARSARLVREADGRMRVSFDEPVRAVAPGQAVVVYAGDVVLGGGCTLVALR